MKKIIIICVSILVVTLCIGFFKILNNVDKKQNDLQENVVQDKIKNMYESTEDEANGKEEVSDDTKDKETNESKDKIVDEQGENVKLSSNTIISTPSIVYDDIKPSTNIEIEEEADEDEFRDDFIEWENMTDSDNDGLPDSYETDIGTDIYNADTDGDGGARWI